MLDACAVCVKLKLGRGGALIDAKDTKKPEDKKIYVLDTNVLMHDPNAVNNFQEHDVYFHICVIGELDRLKRSPAKERDARRASAEIVVYADQGLLCSGISTLGGGKVFVAHTNDADFVALPIDLERTDDNRMIALAKKLQKSFPDKQVIFVSKDNDARITASSCGIISEDYRHDKRIRSLEELHSGVVTLEFGDKNFKLLSEKLKSDGFIGKNYLLHLLGKNVDLIANYCCRLTDADGAELLAIYKEKRNRFNLVATFEAKNKGDVVPRNFYQWFAYAHLIDPSVRMVVLRGRAGAGKTLIALLAGLEQLGSRYNQILVYRMNMEVGISLGYMPGDLEDKFEPWKVPIYDQLELIFRNAKKSEAINPKKTKQGKFDKTKSAELTKDYLSSGSIEILPINNVQGRTFHGKWIIIDEGQNLKPEEAEIIRTRLGSGSKMIFTGDPDSKQIVRPYLGPLSNGLIDTITLLTGKEYFAHLNMQKSERDEIVEDMINTRLES